MGDYGLFPSSGGPVLNREPEDLFDNYIRGYCVVEGDFGNDGDVWPSRFIAVPRQGEFVRSSTGRTLKIQQVTYVLSKSPPHAPIIEVQLGNDNTSVTPT